MTNFRIDLQLFLLWIFKQMENGNRPGVSANFALLTGFFSTRSFVAGIFRVKYESYKIKIKNKENLADFFFNRKKF